MPAWRCVLGLWGGCSRAQRPRPSLNTFWHARCRVGWPTDGSPGPQGGSLVHRKARIYLKVLVQALLALPRGQFFLSPHEPVTCRHCGTVACRYGSYALY